MNRLLSVALLCGSLQAWAATNYATSCSYAHVSAAVAGSARGDTVWVPSGTATWSSTLSLTFGISVIATGGYANCVITRSAGGVAVDVSPDATAIANDETIRVDGFTFDGNNASPYIITVTGAGASATKPFKNLMIGRCKLKNTTTSSSNQGAISTVGQVRGVIFSNVFDRCNVVLKAMGNDLATEWGNSAFQPCSFGTADNMFFECNSILFSSSFSGDAAGWTETGQGARGCFRYNTWDMANAVDTEVWDIHGFQYDDSTGTMISEYYGNWITNSTSYRFIHMRGGQGLFFNNILSSDDSMDIQASSYSGGCASDWGNPAWNPDVTNCYVWNNQLNGAIKNMAIGENNFCTLSENRNWYNYNAAFNGTTGIGRGTSAPGGTCTIGVGYWVASTATPTTDPTVIQAGHLWKATAANTWTDYYTPYTFPHPLSADGGTPPANPTRTANAVTVHVGTMTQPAP